jgi:hypothetical protein
MLTPSAIVTSTENCDPTEAEMAPGEVPIVAATPVFGVAVGVPGVEVAVGVGQMPPGHGSTVTEPLLIALSVIGVANLVSTIGLSSARTLVPTSPAEKTKCTRTPLPVGPTGSEPSVAHASLTDPTPAVNAGQLTERPVLSRNAPFEALTNETTDGS